MTQTENKQKEKMLIIAKNLDGYLACENFAQDLRNKIKENIDKEVKTIQEKKEMPNDNQDHYLLGRIEALQDMNALLDNIYKETVYKQYANVKE